MLSSAGSNPSYFGIMTLKLENSLPNWLRYVNCAPVEKKGLLYLPKSVLNPGSAMAGHTITGFSWKIEGGRNSFSSFVVEYGFCTRWVFIDLT